MHWIGDSGLEKLGNSFGPHQEKHPLAYQGLAGQLAKDRVEHVASFNVRSVLLVRNPLAAVLSWWWHFRYGAHSGSDKFGKEIQFAVDELYTELFHRFTHLQKFIES